MLGFTSQKGVHPPNVEVLPNNSNAADRRKPLVVSLRLSAAADLSR